MALEVHALRIDPVSEVVLAVKQLPTSSIVRCASAKLPALSSSSSSLPLAISPSSASSYPSSCAGLSKLRSLPSGSGARRAWRVTASTTFFGRILCLSLRPKRLFFLLRSDCNFFSFLFQNYFIRIHEFRPWIRKRAQTIVSCDVR